MVKVWNHITRMIHDWPLHCFVFGAKNWMRAAWGLRCFWAESWWMTPEGLAESWYQIWQNFVEGCELSQSHTGHLATTCRVERYGRLWNCTLLYIPIIYQCVGDYWGKEVLDLMLFFGGAILANASDLLLLCYVFVCFFSRFQACPCKAIILC